MKTTTWTIRKNILALASKADLAGLEEALPTIQTEILGLKKLTAAVALRARYLALPRETALQKKWRVWLLDLLAERTRELKADASPAEVAALDRPTILAALAVHLTKGNLKKASTLDDKKLVDLHKVMVAVPATIATAQAALDASTPAQKIRAKGEKARAKKLTKAQAIDKIITDAGIKPYSHEDFNAAKTEAEAVERKKARAKKKAAAEATTSAPSKAEAPSASMKTRKDRPLTDRQVSAIRKSLGVLQG